MRNGSSRPATAISSLVTCPTRSRPWNTPSVSTFFRPSGWNSWTRDFSPSLSLSRRGRGNLSSLPWWEGVRGRGFNWRRGTSMIERYTRPEMARIWSEENKLSQWLRVEIAACDAWAELGEIPQEAAERIRGARFDMARINEVLAETHHDVTAFLRSVQESLGEEG